MARGVRQVVRVKDREQRSAADPTNGQRIPRVHVHSNEPHWAARRRLRNNDPRKERHQDHGAATHHYVTTQEII
jgi:hypothetical protein